MAKVSLTRRGTVLTASGAKGIVNKKLAEEANLKGAHTCEVADAIASAVASNNVAEEMKLVRCFELVQR